MEVTRCLCISSQPSWFWCCSVVFWWQFLTQWWMSFFMCTSTCQKPMELLHCGLKFHTEHFQQTLLWRNRKCKKRSQQRAQIRKTGLPASWGFACLTVLGGHLHSSWPFIFTFIFSNFFFILIFFISFSSSSSSSLLSKALFYLHLHLHLHYHFFFSSFILIFLYFFICTLSHLQSHLYVHLLQLHLDF